jgi:transposase InsO family protein
LDNRQQVHKPHDRGEKNVLLMRKMKVPKERLHSRMEIKVWVKLLYLLTISFLIFLVDSLDYNLFSVSQLCKMGYNNLFTDTGVTVFRRSDDSIAFKGVLDGQLYLVDFNDNNAELDTCLIARTNMGWLWHRRLAHVGMKNLHKLLKGEHILVLTNIHFEKDRICSACQVGKQVGAHHPHKNIMSTDRLLELLHKDLFGPIAYISIGGSKYCLVIVDDYSRYTWVFFLQEKSQTQETLKRFLRRAQNEFGLRIKKIRSGNGTKFMNSQVEGFLEEEGIKHDFSSPYTPQHNGVVESKNRTLLDMARTMIDEYKTSDRFLAEAINTACYSINCLYLHRILKKTSYELLIGKKPNVSYFRVFGSKYFILINRGRNSKFASKAVEGFLLGYDSNTRAYRVFNKSTRLVEVSCDIVFDETNGSQVEQVDFDELDDEESPCVALRNMSIRDVCPKEPEEYPHAQDQLSSSIQASLPIQDEEMAQKEEDEDQDDEPPQEEDIDQGEMKMMKTRKMIKKFKFKDRHTQESTKQFKETTPSTPYLVTSTRG